MWIRSRVTDIAPLLMEFITNRETVITGLLLSAVVTGLLLSAWLHVPWNTSPFMMEGIQTVQTPTYTSEYARLCCTPCLSWAINISVIRSIHRKHSPRLIEWKDIHYLISSLCQLSINDVLVETLRCPKSPPMILHSISSFPNFELRYGKQHQQRISESRLSMAPPYYYSALSNGS